MICRATCAKIEIVKASVVRALNNCQIWGMNQNLKRIIGQAFGNHKGLYKEDIHKWSQNFEGCFDPLPF